MKTLILLLAVIVSVFLPSCAEITFDGGDAGVFTASAGDPTPPSDIELEGHTLDGWYYDEEFTKKFSEDDKIKEDTTLYAKWSPIEYTVTFIADERALTDDSELISQSVCYGQTVKIPYFYKKDTRTAVVGFYLDSEYKEKWDPDTPVTEDLTLYLGWGHYYNSVYFNAPKLYIETDRGAKITSTETYVGCTVTITNTDESPLNKASAKIRGRGNTTWTTISDKKPYRIKFDKKTDLFGMGKEKDYVLIANYRDYTLMRNDLVHRTAHKLGLEYTSETQWIHVFVNGSYDGLYLLCEQTETGTHRVDIGKDDAPGNTEKSGADIGFLIEVDGAGDYEDKRYFRFKPVRTKEHGTRQWRNQYSVTIKSPGPEYITDEQYEYIKDYFEIVNRAIALGDWNTIKRYCDVDSLIDVFIVNELSFSVDMGWAFFLYKPAGEKLHFGPIWDYDQGFGSSDLGGVVYNSWRSGEENLWFTWLLDIDEFKAAVKERYFEVYEDVILTMDSEIDDMYGEYIYDINANFVKWNRAIGHHTWRVPEQIVRLKTYDENVAYLRRWLNNRIKWMTSEINKW